MKKLIITILCLCLMGSIVGCVVSEDPSSSSPSFSVHTPNASDSTSVSNGTNSTNATSVSTPPAFQEQVVVDNDYCTIKITKLEDNSIWGYTLKAYLENKSSDVTYMFSVDSASINGVKADPFFATEVAPGKKANVDIRFMADFTQGHEIGAYTDIALHFRVYDTNDWTADPVATPSTHIYPLGQDQATVYTRKPLDTDLVLADNDQVTVILTGFRNDSIWGYTADLYLVNKTDSTVMFTVDDVSVNGFMIDPFFADSVTAETCAFSSISWSDTELENNGINQVHAIEFLLRAYDELDWNKEDLFRETITITP